MIKPSSSIIPSRVKMEHPLNYAQELEHLSSAMEHQNQQVQSRREKIQELRSKG